MLPSAAIALAAALARRGFRTSLAARGGGGGPVALNKPAAQKLAPEDELNWDDGTANPEYCVDRWDDVSKYTALKWLAGGLGLFAAAGALAAKADKRSTIPFAPRDYPFDDLKVELAGTKGTGPRA